MIIMKKKSYFLKVGFVLLFLSFTCFTTLAFFSRNDIGEIERKSANVLIIRNGKKIPLNNKIKMVLENGDIVQTDAAGKAQITLITGDIIIIAPISKLILTQELVQQGLAEEKSFFVKIWGKLRAKINKKAANRIKFKTDTSTIGIKGTDFVLEFINDTTTVGTIHGLVNLSSETTASEIDIPPGKMSSVSPNGEVLPLIEFAGRLLKDVEFSGKKMDEDNYSGKKMKL